MLLVLFFIACYGSFFIILGPMKHVSICSYLLKNTVDSHWLEIPGLAKSAQIFQGSCHLKSNILFHEIELFPLSAIVV